MEKGNRVKLNELNPHSNGLHFSFQFFVFFETKIIKKINIVVVKKVVKIEIKKFIKKWF